MNYIDHLLYNLYRVLHYSYLYGPILTICYTDFCCCCCCCCCISCLCCSSYICIICAVCYLLEILKSISYKHTDILNNQNKICQVHHRKNHFCNKHNSMLLHNFEMRKLINISFNFNV